MDNQLILAERTLSENLARQKQIEEELNELRRGKAVGSGNDARSDGRPGPLNAKRSLTVFQAPYFKDIRGFSHLPNQDTKTKRLNEELDPYLTNPREWSATEKKKLTLAVSGA